MKEDELVSALCIYLCMYSREQNVESLEYSVPVFPCLPHHTTEVRSQLLATYTSGFITTFYDTLAFPLRSYEDMFPSYSKFGHSAVYDFYIPNL